MSGLLEALLTPPTLVYTALMALVAVFWALVASRVVRVHALDANVLRMDEGQGAESMLQSVGLAGVPLSVVGSVWIAAAWVACAVLIIALRPDAVWLDVLVFMGASGLGFGVVRALAPALRARFASSVREGMRPLIGRAGVVSSARVDGDRGTARIQDGGEELEVEVRCPEKNRLTAGDPVVVIDFDPGRALYRVVAAERALPASLSPDVS